jgi:hypothetical protein
MEFLKSAHVAELFGLAGGMVGAVPAALQALVGPVASLLPITPFNLVCTNIRGPEGPLYLLGHKMLDWYPYVPVGGEMALNCAILSYNGVAYFGFSGDVHAAPDLGHLEGLLKQSFEDLKQDIEKSSPQKHKARTKMSRKTVSAPPAKGSGLQHPTSEPSKSVTITQLAPAEQMTSADVLTPTTVAAD